MKTPKGQHFALGNLNLKDPIPSSPQVAVWQRRNEQVEQYALRSYRRGLVHGAFWATVPWLGLLAVVLYSYFK